MKRRRLIGLIGASGVGVVAGCTGGTDGEENEPTDGTTDQPTTGTTSEEGASGDGYAGDGGSSGQASDEISPGPEHVATAFATAATPEAVSRTLHPQNPLHPANVENADNEVTPLDGSEAESTVKTADATAADLHTVPYLPEAFSEARLRTILDGERAAVVDLTVRLDGDTRRFRLVMATHDSSWLVLWVGEASDRTSTPRAFDHRVVDTVSFDVTADRARVELVDAPVADSVEIRSANTPSHHSTDTPSSVAALDVGLDPSGDELLVTATVDDNLELLHRERYPLANRTVEDVGFDVDDEVQAFVRFGAVDEAVDRLTVTATRSGETASVTDDPSSVHFLAVGLESDGDQVLVTATTDGETRELHRERYHP